MRKTKSEYEWAKNKYRIFNARIDKVEYAKEIAVIEEMGIANFLKKSIEIYRLDPELFILIEKKDLEEKLQNLKKKLKGDY